MTLPKGFYTGKNNKKRSKLTGYLILSGGLTIVIFPIAYLFYWMTYETFLTLHHSPDPLTTILLMGGTILGCVIGGYVTIVGQFWTKQ